MKILHWDEMFHPSFGYQINILSKLQAKQGHEVIVLTSQNIEQHPTFKNFANNNNNIEEEDRNFSKKYNVQVVRLPIHTVISGRVIYKKGYIEAIKSFKPDVIMCHTNDTISAMKIAQKHKDLNIPIVFDNHMLAMASRNPFRKLFRLYFKKVITPLIVKNNWKVIRTQDDDYVNKYLGIPEQQTPFISFGSDTTLFYPDNELKAYYRELYNIKKTEFAVVYTGKLTEAKGGKFFANSILKKFRTSKTIVFFVVGNASSKYEKEVEEIFNKSENRIIRIPTQNYIDLPKFYQIADICVFPKQCSLSFYDAQACGLPVIAEDNNINRERLSHSNGFVFKIDDIKEFRNKITYAAEIPEKELNRLSKNSYQFIKDNYDYEDIARKYTEILVDEYSRYYNQRKESYE